jgi:Carboxypeptidase regulatory-like domain
MALVSFLSRPLLALGLLLATFPASVAAQSARGRVVGVVVARETGEPLSYAIVAAPSLQIELFANDSGVFAFDNVPAGPFRLRVRRLGFAPSEHSVDVSAGITETVRVELSRVAVSLHAVTVRAFPACHKPGIPTDPSDSTLAKVLDQLRLNGEQFRLLSRSYPFRWKVTARRARKRRADSAVVAYGSESFEMDSRKHKAYRPGRLIARDARSYLFLIPTLLDFAEEAFIDSHCFHFGGLSAINDTALVRIDLVAAESIKDPDVNGSIFLDARTFQIRRTFLELSKRIPQVPDMQRFEITTDFGEVLPSIPMISNTFSIRTLDPEYAKVFGEVYEEQKLIEFRFVKNKPGDPGKP